MTRLRLLAVAALVSLLLPVPGTARAQDNEDLLRETAELRLSWFSGGLLGHPDTQQVVWRGPDPELAPLQWDGDRFLLDYAAVDGSGDFWRVAGAVEQGGTNLLDLVAVEHRGTSCPPGITPPCESFIDLGPMPLLDSYETEDRGGQSIVCFSYYLTDDAAEAAVEALRSTIPNMRPAEGVDPGSLPMPIDGPPGASVSVDLCTANIPEPDPVGPSGLAWQADGFTAYGHADLGLDQRSFCLTVPGPEEWCPGPLPNLTLAPLESIAAIDEAIPRTTDSFGFFCDRELFTDFLPDPGMGIATVRTGIGWSFCDGRPGANAVTLVSRFLSEHTWIVPGTLLLPGDLVPADVATLSRTSDPAGGPAQAGTWFLFYPEGATPGAGLLPSDVAAAGGGSSQQAGPAVVVASAEASDPAAAAPEWTGEASGRATSDWKVPGGQPGDRMSLGVLAWGPGGSHLAVYHYVLVAYTPGDDADGEPGADDDTNGDTNGDTTDDGTTGDEEPDDGFIAADDDSFWSDLFDGLPAGFGGIGDIPGPEGWMEGLTGVMAPAVLIGLIGSLGFGGGGRGGGGTDEPGSGPWSGPSMTMTDALGNEHDYDWSDEHGGYINILTGGMFDPTLWTEYNTNLPGNRAFADQQRTKLERGETAFDHDINPDRITMSNTDMAKWVDLIRQSSGVPDGERAVQRAQQLADQVARGEYVSRSQLAAVGRFVIHRATGATAPESSLTRPHAAAAASEGVFSSLGNQDIMKTVVGSWLTGRDPDGSTNWGMIGVRAAAAIATGGTAEVIWGASEAGYIFQDGLDKGQHWTDAAISASIPAITSVLTAGAMKIGGATLGMAGRTSVGRTLGRQAVGLAGEFKVLGQIGGDAIESVVKKVGTIIRRPGVKPPLPKAMVGVKQNVFRAIKESVEHGNDDAVMGLYRNGGMKKLAQLEKAGGLGKAEANYVNKIITNRTNKAIGRSTQEAIEGFSTHPPVKVNRIYVGDSGSSARGGARSIKTDADRTIVAEFDRASLDNYARSHNITRQEAAERLQKELGESIENRVNGDLALDGLTKNDVDFKVYSGFGEGSGQADAYSRKFTNMRQATYGKTTVYRPGKPPYDTSGQAMVDASELGYRQQTGAFHHGSNVERQLGNKLDIVHDPTKGMTPGDCRTVVQKAAEDAATKTDVKSLAKALDRANRGGASLGAGADPDLARLAQAITRNPQEMNKILEQAGMSADEFANAARNETLNLAKTIGATP